VKNLKGGTRRSIRNASSEGNRETGDREWTSAVEYDGEAFFGNPKRQLNAEAFDGSNTKASGKTAQKGRGWISQTFIGLWEFLSVRRWEPETKVSKAGSGRSEVQRASTSAGSASCRRERQVRWSPRSEHRHGRV
jgi:hypothetical protein